MEAAQIFPGPATLAGQRLAHCMQFAIPFGGMRIVEPINGKSLFAESCD
jgi:hypothetical protein